MARIPSNTNVETDSAALFRSALSNFRAEIRFPQSQSTRSYDTFGGLNDRIDRTGNSEFGVGHQVGLDSYIRMRTSTRLLPFNFSPFRFSFISETPVNTFACRWKTKHPHGSSLATVGRFAGTRRLRNRGLWQMAAAQGDEDLDSNPIRVLSIQSHVVHGSVGNKCAVFALQRFGLDVDPINTVHFSNHKGYPVCSGPIINQQQIDDVFEGLEANNLTRYSHVLTGYIGAGGVLESIAKTVRKLKERDNGLVFLCDPVMGDGGWLYVPKELVEIYKESIVPLASVVTPNQYELELLTDMSIEDEKTALEACQALHAKGPHTVIITSINLNDASNTDEITLLASTTVPQSDGHPPIFKMCLKKLPGFYVGTGDLFASSLLAWLTKFPNQLDLAVEHAIGVLRSILKATYEHGKDAFIKGEKDAASWAKRELRIVQGQEFLVNPVIEVKAQPIHTDK